MFGPTQARRSFLVLAALLTAIPTVAVAQSATAVRAAEPRDGSHDFDWEIGSWRTKLRRLQRPLTGSTSWVSYEGTTIVREILNGRSNLVELVIDGPAGKIEGLSLRLYDPEARQWSLNFSNIASGTLSPPVVGEFKDGRGEFYGTDVLYGRTILVRFVMSDITPSSARFEQAFSADGGRTWEVNWIAEDTKVAPR
jgi:hypothetical protein